MGIQSFDEKIREALGRKGSILGLDKKISYLVSAGIKELNIDLIYGIPGQSLTQWKNDLERASSLPITHLSAYNLTIEKKSPIKKRFKVSDINDNTSTLMWDLAEKILKQRSGVKRYEISNYAKQGHECRHNLDFWHGKNYIGLGPAAVSSIGNIRRINPSDIKKWASSEHIVNETLTPEQRAREILILGLRTVRGADVESLRKTTGVDILKTCGESVQKLLKHGLIKIKGSRIKPTKRGLLLADTVAVELI